MINQLKTRDAAVRTILKALCNNSQEVPIRAAHNLISDFKPLILVSTLPIIPEIPTKWENLQINVNLVN